MAFWKRKRNKDTMAGLAIMTSGIYYLELSRDGENLKIAKQEFVGYARAAVRQGSIHDSSAILDSISELSFRIGGFTCPVSLGLPSGDFMIRNVDLPAMDLSMAKDAVQWDFEKHFPYPVAEALYDVSGVDLPSKESEDVVHLLVASIRKKKIEPLLDGLKAQGVPMSSMEPNNVAAFRAAVGNGLVPERGYLVLLVYSDGVQFVIGYRESSLFYRAVPFPPELSLGLEELGNRVVSEIQATMNYIKTIFRDLSIGTIVLGGDPSVRGTLKERISSSMSVPVLTVHPWENWNIVGAPEESGEIESVVGLAVRNLS